MTTTISPKRIAEELRQRGGRRPTKPPLRRSLDPIHEELVNIIFRGASEHDITLTPQQMHDLAAYIAPSLLRLPFAKRPVAVVGVAQVPEDKSEVVLTLRERQVLMGIARGLSADQTGYRLMLAKDTVKTHLRRAYKALGARNASHAVAIAIKYGLLSAEELEEV